MHPVLNLKTNARGNNLSGGFSQSVALARIFLRPERRIVILDESLGQVWLLIVCYEIRWTL